MDVQGSRRKEDHLARALVREREGTRDLRDLLEEEGWEVDYASNLGVLSARRGDRKITKAVANDGHLIGEVRRLGSGRRIADDKCIQEISVELQFARELIAVLHDSGWSWLQYDPQVGILMARSPDGRSVLKAFGPFADELLIRAEAAGCTPEDLLLLVIQNWQQPPPRPHVDVTLTDDTLDALRLIAPEKFEISKTEALREIITTERDRNRRLVLEELRTTRILSLDEFARRTGVSRDAVSLEVGELCEEGLLVRVSTDKARAPAERFAFNAPVAYALGIAFGRRHIRVALADLGLGVDGSRQLVKKSTDVFYPVIDDGPGALARAEAMVRELVTAQHLERVIGVVMGVPAPIDHSVGTIVREFAQGWENLHPAEHMSNKLGLPVELENDANLGALGETNLGAARGHNTVAYVEASGGLGCGLVLKRTLWRGAMGFAGEIGHTIVDTSDHAPQCYCGRKGCLEVYVGGDSLARALGHQTVADVIELAQQDHRGCSEELAKAAQRLGIALVNLCSLDNPSCIVIGGRLGALREDLFITPAKEVVARHRLSAYRRTEVIPGELKEEAAVYGALELALSCQNQYFRDRFDSFFGLS